MIVEKITSGQRRQSMKMAVVVSVASIVAATCGAGNVLSLAAIKLGAGEMFLGFFNFVSIAPFVLGLLTMSAIEKYGKIKVLYPWYVLGAVFLFPIMALPLLAPHWPAWACLFLLAASNGCRNASTALGSTGWFPVLQDIVPRRFTARFFARLRTTWQSANFISLICAALILGKDPSWLQFELLFLLAMGGEIMKALPLKRMYENPPPARPVQMTLPERMHEFFNNDTMRHFSLYNVFYFFAAMALEPFKVKLLSDSGYGYGFVLGATAMVGFGAVASLRFWGRIAERFGNRAIFGISHIGMLLSTLGWVFVGRCSYWGMALVLMLYFFWSLFNSGNNLAQTNYMLRVVPSSKQNFITVIMLFQRMATALAPLLAGLFLEHTKALNFQLGPVPLTGYRVIFTIVAILFLVPHLMRKRLKAPADVPTSTVLSQVAKPFVDTIYVAIKPAKRQNSRYDEN